MNPPRARTNNPAPPPPSGFPLQPDPGIPPPNTYNNSAGNPLANPAPNPPANLAPNLAPNPAASNGVPTADVRGTANAVANLALNPPVTRAKRTVIMAPPDDSTKSTARNHAQDTVPLLVKSFDGTTRQVEVPTTMNVDEIQRMLMEESGLHDGDAYKLSLGDTDLAPGVPLASTSVLPAYAHAGSLLQVIGNGNLEPDKTVQALDSVMGVVRSLSNGVKDMDGLVAAAGSAEGPTADSRTAPDPTAGPPGADPTIPWGESPSPAALVRNLSKQLPTLFTQNASEEFSSSFLAEYNVGLSGLGGSNDIPRFVDPERVGPDTGPQVAQPAISDIANIRRARKQALSRGGNNLVQTGTFPGLSFPALDISTSMAAAAASGYGNGQTVLGSTNDGTWMDDVKSTWEAGLVRDSGLLDKTPTGKDLNATFKAFDDQMRVDEGMGVEKSVPAGPAPGPSAPAASAARALSAMDVDVPKQAGPVLQRSTVPHPPGPLQPPGAGAAPPASQAPQAATAGVFPQNAPGAASQTPSTAPSASSSTPSTGSASGTASPSAPRDGSGQPGLQRKATRIAPSPASHVPPAHLPAKQPPALRRGRRLKNPDFTPEQRAQHRKEQKRASARQSRIRKKSMEDDYQQKVRALLGENNQLKMQVADLSHRLECLQGLLTVSLRPVNGANPTAPQPAPPFAFRPQPQPPNVDRQNGALRPGAPHAPDGRNNQAQFRR